MHFKIAGLPLVVHLFVVANISSLAAQDADQSRTVRSGASDVKHIVEDIRSNEWCDAAVGAALGELLRESESLDRRDLPEYARSAITEELTRAMSALNLNLSKYYTNAYRQAICRQRLFKLVQSVVFAGDVQWPKQAQRAAIEARYAAAIAEFRSIIGSNEAIPTGARVEIKAIVAQTVSSLRDNMFMSPSTYLLTDEDLRSLGEIIRTGIQPVVAYFQEPGRDDYRDEDTLYVLQAVTDIKQKITIHILNVSHPSRVTGDRSRYGAWHEKNIGRLEEINQLVHSAEDEEHRSRKVADESAAVARKSEFDEEWVRLYREKNQREWEQKMLLKPAVASGEEQVASQLVSHRTLLIIANGLLIGGLLFVLVRRQLKSK